MAPPASATAPARRHAGAPSPSRRRAPLRVIPGRLRPGGRRAGSRPETRTRPRPIAAPGRLLNIVAVCLVLGALLAVVVAQAMLANGQVRLSALQHQLSLEQSTHRQAELSVSQLETPSRIVAVATGGLHMVRPANVIQLPYVSLSVPLPAPKVTAAPAPTTTTTAPPAAAQGSGTGGSATAGSSTTPATSTTATSIP